MLEHLLTCQLNNRQLHTNLLHTSCSKLVIFFYFLIVNEKLYWCVHLQSFKDLWYELCVV